MTRIVCISDTHGRHDQLDVPPGDILVHSGDVTTYGLVHEVNAFTKWLKAQPHKHKVWIAGNHDGCLNLWPSFDTDGHYHKQSEDDPSLHYLCNAGVELEGIKFWGSPYTPTFFNWYFMADRGSEIARHWDLIPEDTDVLITHGPPFGALDTVARDGGINVGCESLAKKLELGKIKPKLHVFGHIHEGYGNVELNGIRFVNASSVNSRYKVVNAPVLVDL